MKLLIVTCLKENQEDVADMFGKSGISSYSTSAITGYKKEEQAANLSDSWFGASKELFDSVFLFSFTGVAEAEQALSFIKAYNAGHETDFPVHAFIMPVENSTFDL
jgi:hypothetical protein